MFTRRLAALVLAATIGSVGVLTGSPAYADQPGRCPFITTADATKGAMAVFTGTVDTSTRLEKPEDESGAYFLQSVTLTRVYRGDTIDTQTVEVRTEQTPRECSLGALELGTEYVFFVVDSGDPWVAKSGAGTRVADADTIDKVVRLLGEGRAPLPPEPESAMFTPVGAGDPPTWSEAAAPGAGLVLAGLLGLLVVRAAGRRSATA